MDIKQIEFIFRYMSTQQRKELIQAISAFNLATSINNDEDFITEALDEVGKKYPFIKQYILQNKSC